jgi:hypothetical protein
MESGSSESCDIVRSERRSGRLSDMKLMRDGALAGNPLAAVEVDSTNRRRIKHQQMTFMRENTGRIKGFEVSTVGADIISYVVEVELET